MILTNAGRSTLHKKPLHKKDSFANNTALLFLLLLQLHSQCFANVEFNLKLSIQIKHVLAGFQLYKFVMAY